MCVVFRYNMSQDATVYLALVGGMRSTTSALLYNYVCTSKEANIFKCAGAALTTAVSKLQSDVTELTTYSNVTGKPSKMKKNRTSPSHSRHQVYSTRLQ